MRRVYPLGTLFGIPSVGCFQGLSYPAWHAENGEPGATVSLSSRSRMRMRSARNQERGCVFLWLLSPTRKTPASIFRRLPRWCNPCELCPMNHWQWDPRSTLRMRLRILLEGSFVFACCLLPTPSAKMPFCLSAPARCWKQPRGQDR